MKCPVCNEPDLVMSERQGIEIDYCPKCRGVWLDRGELDKLIDRSAAQPQPTPAPAQPPRYPDERHYRGDDDHYRRGYKKKRGFLGDIFDFD
jgi:Zn-finger nucleic acid-binding protein